MKKDEDDEEDDFAGEDGDPLLEYDADEYDVRFEEMKEANLNSRRVKIDEEIDAARLQVDDAR